MDLTKLQDLRRQQKALQETLESLKEDVKGTRESLAEVARLMGAEIDGLGPSLFDGEADDDAADDV